MAGQRALLVLDNAASTARVAPLLPGSGASFWLTVTAPGAEAADIRGRQLAWLLITGPYTLAVTILLTALSGQQWAWPWALGILPALLGGA